MFAPDGFFSLHDFSMGLLSNYTAEFRKCNEKPTTLEFPVDGAIVEMAIPSMSRMDVWEKLHVAAWTFFDEEKEVSVLSPGGFAVPVGNWLMNYHDPTRARGTYVDLMIGTVGSGGYSHQFEGLPDADFPISKEEAERERIEQMTRFFGPYLYCPVLIPSDAAIKYVERNRAEVVGLGSSSEEANPEFQTVWQWVQEAFPNGKGLATWKDVEEKVGYSRRHIVRAVKANTDYETWARDGHVR